MFFASASTLYTIDILVAIMFLIISYLIGSIPFGIVIGKALTGKDIRNYGSKNIGSTNAIRVLGKKIGFLVFFCDVLKGMVVILIVKALNSSGVWVTPIAEMWYGLAAIIGHSFSIFLGYKGGKAVATSLGVVLVTTPLSAILCLIAFLIVLKTTGYVSLASTAATITVVATAWILYGVGMPIVENSFSTFFPAYLIGKTPLVLCILLSCVATLIILKHIKNYKRLINGTENNFKKSKKAKVEANQ